MLRNARAPPGIAMRVDQVRRSPHPCLYVRMPQPRQLPLGPERSLEIALHLGRAQRHAETASRAERNVRLSVSTRASTSSRNFSTYKRLRLSDDPDVIGCYAAALQLSRHEPLATKNVGHNVCWLGPGSVEPASSGRPYHRLGDPAACFSRWLRFMRAPPPRWPPAECDACDAFAAQLTVEHR